MVAICLMGFFGMGVFPLTVSVTPVEAVPPELGGSSVGFVNLVGEIFGSALLPAVGGMVADRIGLQTTMLLCALCGLVICFWGVLLRETTPKSACTARRASQGGGEHLTHSPRGVPGLRFRTGPGAPASQTPVLKGFAAGLFIGLTIEFRWRSYEYSV